MPNIIDPVTEPSVLREPSFCMDELDFDALSSPLLQLQGKVDKKPQTAAIILAGGTGERFGKEGGKQLVEIAGKPILTWSAEAFDAVGDVGLIVIVCPEERMHEYLSRAIDPFPFVTPVVLAPSGAIRQESAFSGLETVGDEYEYVVLHDGARPLVSPDLIEHTINMVKGNFDADGAIVAHPAVDTLKVVERRRGGGHPRPFGLLECPDAPGLPRGHLPPRPCERAVRRLRGNRRLVAHRAAWRQSADRGREARQH